MTTLEIICLYGLGISLCLLLFDAAGKTLRAAWRRNGRRYGVAASLIGLAVVCTINAQKPGPTPVITVDAFLRDAGSYATNDVLHVAVTNAPAYAGIDFSSCPVLVYARQRGLSDAPEWEELLPRRTFSELPADYAIEDATNYNYLVYLDYVPPSPVHTNGVFELRGFMVPGDEPGNLEQLAAGFINSRAITIRDLPYDAEVEYLESTGTQWIDTGYAFNSASDKVELVFELLTTTPRYKWIFGAYDTQKRLAIGSGDAQGRRTLGYNASTSYNSDAYYTNGAHIYSADSTGASIDGHNFFGFADFSTTSHIILYSIPIDPSTYCANARIWSYKHYRNGDLVRDYIPVRVGTTGELYDRVSGTLATRHGDFQYGQDVVPVEYIESHGTEVIDTLSAVNINDSFVLDITGTFTSTTSAYGQFHGVNVGAYFGALANGHIAAGGLDTGVAMDTSNHHFVLSATIGNSKSVSLSVDGTIYSRTRNIAAGHVSLFDLLNDNKSTMQYFCKFKMNDAKLNVNGATVRSFRPVRVGTEGALMDTLTRRIYRNVGTGNFGYGNDK